MLINLKNIFYGLPRHHVILSAVLLLIALALALSPNTASSSLSSEKVLEAASMPIALPLLSDIRTKEELVPQWHSFIIEEGDTLSTLFETADLGQSTLKELYNIDKKYLKPLETIRPKQAIDLLIKSDNQLQGLRYQKDKETLLEIYRNSIDEFKGSLVSFPQDKEHHYAQGEINSSFYLAAKQQGLSDKTIMNLAKIFAYDIDFVMDIRKGDKFKVVYEKLYINGEHIKDGDILAAEFTVRNKTLTALRYENSKGDIGFYTPEGRSIKKEFLRTPVDFTRISSKFNPNRLHPIFKTKRPHNGVDYAAPTNTPVYAAGSGRVSFVGTKGGYGKTVIIDHGNSQQTLYAHLNKYARKVKKGTRVSQGQSIGYVGSTGWATGPHLHYEFRIKGKHKDPLKVTQSMTNKMPLKELYRFREESKTLLSMLVDKRGVIAYVDNTSINL